MQEVNRNLLPNMILFQKLDYKNVIFAIEAAAYFNIASLIADGQKTTEQLAQATETNEDALYRVLRLLAADGIFTEVSPHTFANSEISTYLRDDVPESLHGLACMRQSKRYRQEWDHLEEWIRTGQSVCEMVSGMPLYKYFDQHPEDAALFDRGVGNFSVLFDKAIVAAYKFAGVVVDVAGGRGNLLSLICEHHPNIHGVLFEQPNVIERVKSEATKISYELVGGNFFDGVPSNGDMYILKGVLHNWDDDHCITILQRCQQAMKPNGRLLVCEHGIDPSNNRDLITKGFDILVGLEHQGRERTVEEFAALFRASGLKLANSIPTHSPLWIFEAVQK